MIQIFNRNTGPEVSPDQVPHNELVGADENRMTMCSAFRLNYDEVMTLNSVSPRAWSLITYICTRSLSSALARGHQRERRCCRVHLIESLVSGFEAQTWT